MPARPGTEHPAARHVSPRPASRARRHIAQVVSCQPQIVPHGGCVRVEEFGRPFGGDGELPAEQMRRDLQPGGFDAGERVHRARGPPSLRLSEEAEVVEGAHPGHVSEVERRVERERCGGPLEHGFQSNPP